MNFCNFLSRHLSPRHFFKILFLGFVLLLVFIVRTKYIGENANDDSSQLIDVTDFKFLINHKSCKHLRKQPTVVIMIYTAPIYLSKRTAIRETWGYKDPRALLIFLIGFIKDKDLQRKIDIENDLFGDIVQGSFIESYRNLTYKHVMGLKWFVYNCPDVPFLFKLDDDAFINTPLLYNYLENPSEESSALHMKPQLFCHVFHNSRVERLKTDRFPLTIEEYPASNFPDYCQGYNILYSSDAASAVYKKAQTLPYFYIEDVHMSGTITSMLHIPVVSNFKFFKPEGEAMITKNSSFLFTSADLTEGTIRKIWDNVGKNAKINLKDLL